MTPTLADIFLARWRIAGLVRRTPLVRSAWLSRLAAATVLLKLESQQVTGAFKIRGALNAVRALTSDRAQEVTADGVRPGVVTASAGNHGLALAEAARAARVRAIIFTPRDAARAKLDAVREAGADLRAVARDYDDAERLARECAAESGATFISGYADPGVIAGNGTIGLEIVEDLPGFAPPAACIRPTIVVPVGGGGLVSGIATAVKSILPTARVVGVEAATNLAFRVSVDRGRISEIPIQPTVADGLVGNLEPGAMTFDIVRELVDDLVSVTDAEMKTTIRELLAEERLVAEGAGIAAVAAVATGRVRPGDGPVVAIVSGSNIDAEKLAAIVAPR